MAEMNLQLRPDENYIPTGLPGGFFIYNARGNEEILFAEHNVLQLFGCETIAQLREHTGNSFRGMVHPDDVAKIENDIQSQTMGDEKRHDYVRYRIITRQGEVRYVEDFGHLLHGTNGVSYFYVFIMDVDQDEYLNRSHNSFAEAQILSMNQNTDRLTGLFNMSNFYQAGQDMIAAQAKNSESTLSFVHFDILNFKLFNERYGFQRGDDLLCRMAYTIRSIFSDGPVARFSNDHFAVCTTAKEVTYMVNEVHNNILHIFEGARVEIRAGIYQLEDNCHEIGLACDRARIACNMAKKRYDVIYNIYDVSLHEKLLKQQYIVDHIDEAVEKEYIKVFYQPVIRVKTGEICGYEALVRWQDPTFGMLSPFDFISTLEQFHLIHKIDGFVIQKVCEDYCTLQEHGASLVPVSINLSRLDFELCDIYELIERNTRLYNVPRDMLDIEITESILNEHNDLVKVECKRLHDIGYQIWIDDFGSGYSSLNILTEYEFDVLKLDLQFLRSYDKNPKTGDLMTYIIYGAREMDILSLVEGVETKEHYEFLKSIGCEKAQGYYFGKPQPMEESRKTTMEAGLTWEKVPKRI